MSDDLIRTVGDMFAAAIKKTWKDATAPLPTVTCTICGCEGVPASKTKPGVCWLCVEE